MVKTIYIVTGGAGFIGSNIIDKLKYVTKEESVILCFDKKPIDEVNLILGKTLVKNNDCSFLSNNFINDDNFYYHHKDLEDYFDSDTARYQSRDFVELVNQFIDCFYNYPNEIRVEFIHCASPVGVNVHTINDLYDVGYNLSLLVTKAIETIKIIPNIKVGLYFMSSSEVYGEIDLSSVDEIDTFKSNRDYDYFNKYLKNHFKGPRSGYVRQKLASELLFLSIEDIDLKIFRLFNIFGPGQDPKNGVIPLFIQKLLSEETELLTFGENIRTYTHLKYAINVIVDNIINNGKNGLINIVNDDISFTDKYVLDKIIESLDSVEIPYKLNNTILVEILMDKKVQSEIINLWQKNIKIVSSKVKTLEIQLGDHKYKKYLLQVSNNTEIKKRVISTVIDADLPVGNMDFDMVELLKKQKGI